MAANQIIVKSAGQAYTPAKGEGQGNIIGMLQAVTSIGKGMATRDAKITKGLEIIDGMTIDTDMEPLKEMFIEKQQALANSSLPDINKGIKDLKLLQLHAKESLPKIKEFMFKMQKEKFSNGVDPLAANYIDAFLTGRLDGTVTVKDKETGDEQEVPTWMIPNANKDGVVVVGLDGNYVDPAVLLKQLTGMVRVSDSKEAYDLTTNYLKRTDLKWSADGEGTKKWKTISTTYMDEMRNEWENDPNSFVSFALDRKHTINGVRTSFSQEYLNNFLDGAEEEALNALVEDYALNQDPPIAVEAVSDKVKGLLVREIMLSDPDLENDKNDYLQMVTNSMEPLKPENIEEYNYTNLPLTGYKPGAKNPALNINKLTKEDKRDYEVIKDIEEMISGMEAGQDLGEAELIKLQNKISTTIGAGLKLQIVKKEGTDNVYYFRENMFGATDANGAEIEKRLSPTFDITNKKQVRNIMPTILAQYGIRPGETIYEDYFKYYNVK